MFKKKEVRVFVTCMASIVCGVLIATVIKANVTVETADHDCKFYDFDVKGDVKAPDTDEDYDHKYTCEKISGIVKDVSEVDEISDNFHVFMDDENADKCYTIYLDSGDANVCIGSDEDYEKGDDVSVYETKSYDKAGNLVYVDFDLK